jgi:hypothetical protein
MRNKSFLFIWAETSLVSGLVLYGGSSACAVVKRMESNLGSFCSGSPYARCTWREILGQHLAGSIHIYD